MCDYVVVKTLINEALMVCYSYEDLLFFILSEYGIILRKWNSTCSILRLIREPVLPNVSLNFQGH